MKKRPIIKLKLSRADKIMEITGWISILAIWSYTIIAYKSLPERIATHYDISGNADAFGSKRKLFELPAVVTIIFLGITLLNRAPHIYNYLTDISAENALVEYTKATKMLRILKLTVVLVFAIIIVHITGMGTGQELNLGVWFLPLVSLLFFLPLVLYIKNPFSRKKD